MWSVGLLVVATVDGRLCLLLQFHHGAGRMWSPFPRHVQHLLCCTDDGNMTARDVSRQSGWLEPLLCSRQSYQARQTHIHAVPWLHSSQTVTKPQGCLSFIMWHKHVSSCIYTTPLMQCLVSKHQGKWLEFRAAVFHQCKGESDIHFTFASTKCTIEKWSFISGDKVSLFSTGPWKLQSFWKTDFKKYFPSLLCIHIFAATFTFLNIKTFGIIFHSLHWLQQLRQFWLVSTSPNQSINQLFCDSWSTI